MSEAPAARPWLAPLVPLYRVGLAWREWRLRTGLEPVRRLRWPVVSIGNLTTGGAGKTPLTIALAQALTRRGFSVDVLSRGYGRSGRGAARVDPEGTAEEFGDEPLEIARAAHVPVYVAAQRYEAGLVAEGNGAYQAARVHLLDDGFQHRQLARTADILILSREDWQDRLLPAGNLREPLRAARRAGCVAIPGEDRDFETVLRNWGWEGPVWRLHRRMEVPPIDGPAVAFCGIARPEQFFDGLERAGLRLAANIAFSDHHRYTHSDLDRLARTARNSNAAAFVTTEKDRTRMGRAAAELAALCPLKTAGLRIEIEDEEAAIKWVMGRLSRHLPEPRA